MKRRGFLLGALSGVVAAVASRPALAFHEPLFWFDEPEYYDEEEAYQRYLARRRRKRISKDLAKRKSAKKKTASEKKKSKPAYTGRTTVTYFSLEKPGTIIIKTRERALYQVLGGGKARRFLVAVGKEGFSWSGTAKVGLKRVNPTWTPPAEMIERKPEYAEWSDGMPGGIPENPLGVRAMYLYRNGRDTLFRIHGTNNPSSIGTAASSGCIRMLNHEVVELYANTPVGTKVIVS